ncbi:MAG: hypothetical protein QXU32_03240 [Nitrososphaerales archaeon]
MIRDLDLTHKSANNQLRYTKNSGCYGAGTRHVIAMVLDSAGGGGVQRN